MLRCFLSQAPLKRPNFHKKRPEQFVVLRPWSGLEYLEAEEQQRRIKSDEIQQEFKNIIQIKQK